MNVRSRVVETGESELVVFKKIARTVFNGMAYRFIFVSLYEMTVSPSGADIKKTVQVHTHTDVVS